jgi:Protein of unknown function (DUF2384)
MGEPLKRHAKKRKRPKRSTIIDIDIWRELDILLPIDEEIEMQVRDVAIPFRGFEADLAGPLPPQHPLLITDDEARAMQRAIIRLFEHWGITDNEASIVLGDVSPRTFQRWKVGQYGRAGVDLIARMSNLLGIHKALRMLFSDPVRGYRWVRAANDAFGGKSALNIMLAGQITDLMRVRRYLDAQRGAW